jgi:AcrR family transcriptional regulator
VQESYDAVSLREIAGAAGVDVALIGRYFGSKEKLFQAALATEDDQWEELARADDLPSYLVAMFVTDDSKDAEHIERLLIMLRSAASPTASIIVRSTFKNEVLEPFAKILTGRQAELRASMALAVLMGTTIVRTILKVEHCGGCEDETFQLRLLAMLRLALCPDDDLPGLPLFGVEPQR